MELRPALDEDVPAIVALLKRSLGEGLMPKSEHYWQWKHTLNPFGRSPVLVAEEDGLLVGVRAFMRWQWTDGRRKYKALRAVDTATDPGHQGKGIFKKLTLQLIHSCEQDGSDFIFNTPNEKSKPGYIKMGWEEAGKLPLNLKFPNAIKSAFNIVTGNNNVKDYQDGSLSQVLGHPGLEDLLRVTINEKEKIHTDYSPAYLTWRYLHVPVATYHACILERNKMLDAILIYRIKSSRIGRELRITDIFARSSKDAAALWPLLEECVKKHEADYITCSGLNKHLPVFSSSFLFRKMIQGPMVTVRKVNSEIHHLKTFNQWSPSLGDLELF
jgi:GNAT superfamily N-acetyltransferase